MKQKKIKMADWKKLSVSKAEQFSPKFQKLVLGWLESIDAKGIFLLNLYGCQTVQCKLNLLLEMHF